jgi:DNA repair photolyase
VTKITPVADRPVLTDCTLAGFAHQVDPYIGCGHRCAYCYVLGQAETDWSEEIFRHEDLLSRLEMELSSVPPQSIYMGWHTDPYQPCEARAGQTRGVLELLAEMGFSATILTKSDLVLRDLDLLAKMPGAAVSTSVAFQDDRVRRRFEADTVDTGKRIAALAALRAEGVDTAALVCPVIPHLTDAEALVRALAPHTDTVRIYGLGFPDRSDPGWRNVADILERHHPERREAIEAAVFSKEHPYWAGLRTRLGDTARRMGLDLRIHL